MAVARLSVGLTGMLTIRVGRPSLEAVVEAAEERIDQVALHRGVLIAATQLLGEAVAMIRARSMCSSG